MERVYMYIIIYSVYVYNVYNAKVIQEWGLAHVQ